jgi:hypothetical protein
MSSIFVDYIITNSQMEFCFNWVIAASVDRLAYDAVVSYVGKLYTLPIIQW